MRVPAHGSGYYPVVERVRLVRARRGVASQSAAAGASAEQRRHRRNARIWLTVAIFWVLCLAGVLDVSLHVRAALARRPAAATIAPRDPPLLGPAARDWLIRRVTVAPAYRFSPFAGTAETAAWSPNGRYLAVGYSSGGLLIWDAARRRRAYWLAGAHRRFVNTLAWSPDGRLLASGAPDGKVILWAFGAHGMLTRLWTLHIAARPPYVPAVTISLRGDQLAV